MNITGINFSWGPLRLCVDDGLGGERQRQGLHFQRMSVQFQVGPRRIFKFATVRGDRAGTHRRLVVLPVRLALARHLLAQRHLVGELEGLAQSQNYVGRVVLKIVRF